jgi:phosphoglycerate dehydrogenase-like enzyme
MRTIGVRRTPRDEGNGPDEVVSSDRLLEAISRADVVVLTCPLTAETDKLIGIEQLSAMKTSGLLINVARGRVVDQSALISALQSGVIAGAALDCFVEEPLPPSSPLWGYSNVLITPHSAGNTQRYEDNVAAILAENIARLEAGASRLLNQVNLQEE